MPTPLQGLASPGSSSSNQSLLGAALAGLLCLTPAGCSSKDDGPNATGVAGSGQNDVAGASATVGGQTGSGSAGSDAGRGGTAGSDVGAIGGAAPSPADGGGNAPAGGGNAPAAGGSASPGAGGGGSGNMAGTGGAPPAVGHITSSAPAGVLTEADFKALCEARSGTVEVMPHCGGFATAKGFAYDDSTQLLSEHTCAGANTCGGWNCVVVD